MKRLRPSLWHLGAVAALLAATSFCALDYDRNDYQAGVAGLVGVLALMLLLELPALWWRARGGGALGTFAVAVAVPLLIFEAWLGYVALTYRSSGGDLQGIEQWLMVAALLPILVTAALVTGLALLFVEADPPLD